MGVTSLSRDGIVANQKYSSALAGNDTADVALSSDFLIQEVVLNGTGDNITFSNIPQTYKHLQLRFVAKSSTSSVSDALLRFNGDTGNNYVWHELQGNGSSVSSSANTNQTIMRVATLPKTGDTNSFAAGVVDILDYTSTSKNKTIRTLAGNHSSDLRTHLYSGLWLNTAAVTSIIVSGAPGAYSRFSLYGSKG